MKVRELLKDETCWTKGAYARDEKGNDIPATSEQATCFCLRGAIRKCYLDPEIREKVLETVYREIEYPRGISFWNDNPHRTFEDVKELVERLDI